MKRVLCYVKMSEGARKLGYGSELAMMREGQYQSRNKGKSRVTDVIEEGVQGK